MPDISLFSIHLNHKLKSITVKEKKPVDKKNEIEWICCNVKIYIHSFEYQQ